MRWYLQVLKKYAVFTGRARRREYWMFVLFNLIVAVVIGFIEGMLGIAPDTNQSVLVGFYELAILIPSIAVGVRRMHDTDHSGWWLLFPVVNLFLAVREGRQGDNRFGPDPKATPVHVAAAVVPSAVPGYAEAHVARPIPNSFCARCGTRFKDMAAFCENCGAARPA